MKKQLQLIIAAIFMILTSLTGYGQNVGDEFPRNAITYKVINRNPDRLEIIDNANTGALNIPRTLTQ